MIFNYLHGEKTSDTRGLFNLVDKGMMKSKGLKLKSVKFKL